MVLETFLEDFLFYALLTFSCSITAFMINKHIRRLRKKELKKKFKLYKLVSIEDISEENAKVLNHHSMINKKLSIDPNRKVELKVDSCEEEKNPVKKVKIHITPSRNENLIENESVRPTREYRR